MMWRLQHGCNRRWKQWALLLTAAGLVGAHGDIQGPGGGEKGEKGEKKREKPSENIRRATEIPTPKDATIRVLRGRPTEIVLEATPALRQPVEFRLGASPKAGTLSPPRPAGDSSERAVVIYTASSQSMAREDSFTFRVKHRDTATSGSATVRLQIIDPRAELNAPVQIDFGEVMVGEAAVRTLDVVNRGTGLYAGRLDLSPPWRLIEAAPDLELAPGERAELRISFSPLRPGPESFVISYSGQPSLRTTLTALAGSPVTLEPALVQMEWRAADHTRRAEVTFLNRTGAPALCEVSTSPRIRLSQPSLNVAAGASQKVELVLPAEDPGELQAPLTVQTGPTRVQVPVIAPPAPAWLRMREAQKLDKSGSVYLVSAATEGAALVVENAGGVPARLLVQPPAGFALLGYEDGKDLGPGEIRRLSLETHRSRGPAIEGNLLCQLDESRLSVPLRTVTVGSESPPSTPSASPPPPGRDALLESQSHAPATGLTEGSARALTGDEQQLSDMIDMYGIFPAGIQFDNSLPELKSMVRKSMTPTKMTVSVLMPGPEYDCIVFRQEQHVRAGSSKPIRYWMPWDGLEFRKSGGEILVTFKNMQPGSRHAIRLAAKAPDGRIGPASVVVHLTMPAKPSRAWLWWSLGGLAGLGAFWWWRRRQALE